MDLESQTTLVDMCSPLAETLAGPLVKIYSQFDPHTIQHADEIIKARRTLEDKEEKRALRKSRLLTADFPLYKNEEGKAILYLARIENHLIFQNLEKAIEQLSTAPHNYKLKKRDAQTIIEAESTSKIELSKLDLSKFNEAGSFELDTANPERGLNPERRKLVERIFGSMRKKSGEELTDFEKNMQMFTDEMFKGEEYKDNKKIEIVVLHPEYIKDTLKRNSTLARLCRLEDFYHGSKFFAMEYEVKDYRLRGIKPSEIEYTHDLNRLLTNPQKLNRERTLRLVDLIIKKEIDKEAALKLLNFVTKIYNQQKNNS